jgi:diaminopimelate epimerase
MQGIPFHKYQGAGNDFIMIDQRDRQWITRKDQALVEHLCHRRFGIGADGLILLQNHPDYDFEMVYFNADGRESSMCGNGGRCIAAFAKDIGAAGNSCRFWAIDGEHEAHIDPETNRVSLKMIDVQGVENQENVVVLNTGSPHYVRFEQHIQQCDMVAEGRAVRYGERFKAEGINVNLVEINPDGSLSIRTYERGVEDETLACGTGVTAAALAYAQYAQGNTSLAEIKVHARGGDLSVRFSAQGNGAFSDIWLTGPAEFVFRGEVGLLIHHI